MVKMKMKMCVLFVILALVSQHASGVEVEVYEGDESVLLPCQFALISVDHAIVWRRDDLGSLVIHSIVDGKVDLSSQNNRTSMRADALQSGDLSLTLRNPTFTDSGTYTCLIRKDGENKQRTEVQLKVTERPVWPKVLPAVLVPVLLLSAFFVFLLYRVKERQNLRTVGQLTPVEVSEGEPSVLLPYKPTCDLKDAVRVKWIKVETKEQDVCVFENGQILPVYKNKTEMKESALKVHDVSLTLKNPLRSNGGVYICSIYDKDGNTIHQKVVPLLVREPLWKSIKAVFGCLRFNLSDYDEESAEEIHHLNAPPV